MLSRYFFHSIFTMFRRHLFLNAFSLLFAQPRKSITLSDPCAVTVTTSPDTFMLKQFKNGCIPQFCSLCFLNPYVPTNRSNVRAVVVFIFFFNFYHIYTCATLSKCVLKRVTIPSFHACCIKILFGQPP